MNPARLLIGIPELKLFHTSGLAALITWFTAAAALGLLAYWSSILLSPRPVAALHASIEAPRSATAEQDMARIFGVQPGGVTANVDGLVLTGVFAPQGGNGGFATFRTAKGGAGVVVGQEIIPGLRLERVEPMRVVVSSSGQERILDLPKPSLDVLGGGNTVKPKQQPEPEPES
jgi:hypothetical protein